MSQAVNIPRQVARGVNSCAEFSAAIEEHDTYVRGGYTEVQDREALLSETFCSDEASALLFANGMAAIGTVLRTLLKAGDQVVASDTLYVHSRILLKQLAENWGVQVVFIDPTDQKALRAAVTDQTKVIFTEVIGNGFTMPVADLETMTQLVSGNPQILLVIDNTLLGPTLFNPWFHFNESIPRNQVVVVESCTKYYGLGNIGQGGVIYATNCWIDKLWKQRTVDGSIMQPSVLAQWPAYTLEQMAERMRCHSEHAYNLAVLLSAHKNDVQEVNHPSLPEHPDHQRRVGQYGFPGCGGVLYVKIRGGAEAAMRFADGYAEAMGLPLIMTSFGHEQTTVFPLAVYKEHFPEELWGVVRIAAGYNRPMGLEQSAEAFRQALAHISP